MDENRYKIDQQKETLKTDQLVTRSEWEQSKMIQIYLFWIINIRKSTAYIKKYYELDLKV